jgi:hypothetical protein
LFSQGLNRTRKKYKINREQNRDQTTVTNAAAASASTVSLANNGGGSSSRKRQQANQNVDSLTPEPTSSGRAG